MNRKDQIKKNLNGGTTAPASTAKGPNYGVSAGHAFQQGIAAHKAVPQTPAAPATPKAPEPLPWDVAASNDEAAALRKYDDSTTSLGANWEQTQQSYGLEGPWADLKTNPYSQAALLQRKADNAQKGTMNSYAAGGHLYSGALGRAVEGNDRAFDISRDQLEKSYAEAGAKNTAELAGAGDTLREADDEANWNRINTGLKEEPDATAVPRKNTIKKNLKGKKGKK